ncbi:MAG: hypothetical protein JRN15_12795, partial [Nitrososphaerota archaeon]|nr:hypothetical protein [Nitrososphaerota archaeon]
FPLRFTSTSKKRNLPPSSPATPKRQLTRLWNLFVNAFSKVPDAEVLTTEVVPREFVDEFIVKEGKVQRQRFGLLRLPFDSDWNLRRT